MKSNTSSSSISNIKEVLQELDATSSTLTKAEKLALDEQGYLILPNLIDPAWLKQLGAAFEQINEQQRDVADNQTRQESGTRHIENLIERDAVFEGIFTHPKLLAAVYQILKRDFRLATLAGRDPLPGYGQQGLHADWGLRLLSEPFQMVNSIWMLDDFTATSGPTRFVPGSHLLYGKPDKILTDPATNHPKQTLAIAPAGSVFIFNSHLWHSGTRNRSDKHRRSLTCSFVGRENRMYSNPALTNPTRFAPAVRYILGFHDEEQKS